MFGTLMPSSSVMRGGAGTAAHPCYCSPGGAEAGDLPEVQGQLGLYVNNQERKERGWGGERKKGREREVLREKADLCRLIPQLSSTVGNN